MSAKKYVTSCTFACVLAGLLCVACAGSPTPSSPTDDASKPEQQQAASSVRDFTLFAQVEKKLREKEMELKKKEEEIKELKEAAKKSSKVCRMSEGISLAGFCDGKKSDQNTCEGLTKIKKDGSDVQLCDFTEGSAESCKLENHEALCRSRVRAPIDGVRCAEIGLTDDGEDHFWNLCSEPAVGLMLPRTGPCGTAHGDPCEKIWNATGKTEGDCANIKLAPDLRVKQYQGHDLGAADTSAEGAKTPEAACDVAANVVLGSYKNICTYRAKKENICLPNADVTGDLCSAFAAEECESKSHGLCASVDLSPPSDDAADDNDDT